MTSNQTQLGGLYLGLTIYRDTFHHISEGMERLCNAGYIVYVCSQEAQTATGRQHPSSFYPMGFWPMGWYHPLIGWVFPPHLNVSY